MTLQESLEKVNNPLTTSGTGNNEQDTFAPAAELSLKNEPFAYSLSRQVSVDPKILHEKRFVAALPESSESSHARFGLIACINFLRSGT